MTDYIKVGSDRPDFRRTLTDPGGRPVDLTNASSVAIQMWSPDATLLINDTASIDIASEGVVAYDFSRDQTVAVGTNDVEILVNWSNGDKQWFPVATQSYEVEIVRSPGDRDANLDAPGATEDGEVNRLTVHDAIEPASGALTLDGDVSVAGDISVTGGVSIDEQSLADGESITYGTDGDFETTYDAVADRWKLTDLTNSHDAIRVDRQGNLILPVGGIHTESGTVYDRATGRIGAGLVDATSLDLGISPTWAAVHTFAAGLDVRGDVVDDGTTIYDASSQTIPASVVESDGSGEGSITINSGKGIKGGASVGFGDSLTLNIEPGDFAGTGLQDDGSDNLQLASGGVTASHLATGSVGSGEIQTDAVNGDAIASSAVGVDELGTDVVGTDAIVETMSPTWTGTHNFTGTVDRDGEPIANVHQQPNAHLPLTEVPDGERAYQCVVVPDGETFELAAWGVTDSGGSVPNVDLEVFDESGSLLYGGGGNATKYEKGSPLYETTNNSGSPATINLTVYNNSGSALNASAFFSYTVSL